MLNKKAMMAAPAAVPQYIEDVFSTYLYTGNGSIKSITNGIALESFSGGLFSGTSSYASLPNGAANLALGTGDFTIECYIQDFGASNSYQRIFWFQFNNVNTGSGLSVERFLSSDGWSYTLNSSSGNQINGGAVIAVNTPVHIAVTRSGTTTRLYVNGLWQGNVIDTGNYTAATGPLIGTAYEDGTLRSNSFAGIIGSFRVVKGTALYTSTASFTPPTAPLTAVSGTQLLCLQGASPFVDTSANNYTITNNSVVAYDVEGKGGMVWLKSRSVGTNHFLFDTTRGVLNEINSNTTEFQVSLASSLTSFNANGFLLGSAAGINVNAATYASWTFRKAPKFFDVVTYTGNGVAGRTVAHNLGSVPGMIIVKRTDVSGNWAVYHRSLTATKRIFLNQTEPQTITSVYWNDTAPTSTVFSLGTDSDVNASGSTYVAYLFAHDAGGFGEAGDQNVVSCGTYNGNGSAAGRTITLGYEPQFLMIKNAAGTGNWQIIDNMRGMSVGSADATLQANLSNAESAVDYVSPLATGFQITSTSSEVNTGGEAYIYLAIRRGPMKTPTVGTSVYNASVPSSTSAGQVLTSGFTDDLIFQKYRTLTASFNVADRLRGIGVLSTANTNAENTGQDRYQFDVQDGVELVIGDGAYSMLYYHFRRAPGFFDVVCYTGNGSGIQTINHNLGTTPEFMIVKRRNAGGTGGSAGFAVWNVWHKNIVGVTRLNSNAAVVTSPTFLSEGTATTFPAYEVSGSFEATNSGGGATYVAYLFATVPNVSKVGSYTGTGGTQTINAGLPTGARFVLIKRTDSTGDWWVWDTSRGMVSGTDPRLALNTTAAELNNNWVYTIANGFQIVTTDATINASGGSYIYLAIA